MWKTGKAKCGLCQHEWVAVMEVEDGDPQMNLECPNCHNMSGEFNDSTEQERA